MKPLLVAWMALMLPSIALGCDVCGIFLGIQPHERNSSVSLFWRYRRLEGNVLVPGSTTITPKHGGHGIAPSEDTEVHYRELYQVAEIRGDFWVAERVAVLASIPLVNNYRSVDGYVSTDVYGVGDPFILARYQVVNTKCLTPDERVVHRLMLGAGAKLPLGPSDLSYQGSVVEVDQQPGTGTWDLLGSAEYKVRHDRNGAGLTMVGRYNTANSEGYSLGNGLSTTAEVFRRYDFGEDWKWMPSMGAYHERSGMDQDGSEPVDGTGSSTLFAHVASRLWWRSWGLSATFQYVVAQDIGSLMIPNKERVVIGLTYNLNS
ncbi:MAG: hypothetical protein KDC00_04100 [Flavobacteriales bacterium]|nr:hypothetical protein [Flavobacteriales bacterium]